MSGHKGFDDPRPVPESIELSARMRYYQYCGTLADLGQEEVSPVKRNRSERVGPPQCALANFSRPASSCFVGQPRPDPESGIFDRRHEITTAFQKRILSTRVSHLNRRLRLLRG